MLPFKSSHKNHHYIVDVPILTVEALPAACKPLKTNSTAKLGEKLSAILEMIYNPNEAI